MTSPAVARDATLYFFLSRCRAEVDHRGSDQDYWVCQVFEDLCHTVRSMRNRRWEAGYLDPCLDETTEVEARHAIDAARVFVAFCSLPYLNDERSRRLRDLFASRFDASGVDEVVPHVLPVIWEPPPEAHHFPIFRQAVDVAPGLHEYAELGLGALKRLTNYHDTYRRLLHVLSRWIVDVAEDSQVAAPLLPEPQRETARRRGRFTVAALAPTAAEAALVGRNSDRYGLRPVDWRPFGPTQALPVVRHTAVRVPVQHIAGVADYDPTGGAFDDSAGLLLVDPWILALPDGRQRLAEAVQALPTWAPALVVIDQDDPQYYPRGSQFVEEALRICQEAQMAVVFRASARPDIKDVESFDVIMPYWLRTAIRRFGNRPHSRKRGSYGRRPRLGDLTTDDEGGTGAE